MHRKRKTKGMPCSGMLWAAIVMMEIQRLSAVSGRRDFGMDHILRASGTVAQWTSL